MTRTVCVVVAAVFATGCVTTTYRYSPKTILNKEERACLLQKCPFEPGDKQFRSCMKKRCKIEFESEQGHCYENEDQCFERTQPSQFGSVLLGLLGLVLTGAYLYSKVCEKGRC